MIGEWEPPTFPESGKLPAGHPMAGRATCPVCEVPLESGQMIRFVVGVYSGETQEQIRERNGGRLGTSEPTVIPPEMLPNTVLIAAHIGCVEFETRHKTD